MASTIEQTTDDILTGTTGALGPRCYQLGKDGALDVDEYPFAQIIEHLDRNVCPVCATVHGKIVRKGTPEYARWHLPSHINCRRVMVDLHNDQRDNEGNPPQPDLIEPPEGMSEKTWQTLIKQHGHFLNDPKKYARLRVPARPTGRDFIFQKGKPGERGTLKFAKAFSDKLLQQETVEIARNALAQHAAGELDDEALGETLDQCVSVPAMRARRFADHYDNDYLAHGRQWDGDLTQEEYWSIPDAMLDADHRVYLTRRVRRKYGEDNPTALFRARDLLLPTEQGEAHLPDVIFEWDLDRGTLWHVCPFEPGKYDQLKPLV